MRTLAILVVLLAVSGSARADGRPQISVAIASSHDESPGDRAAAERDANRETIRQALLAELKASPQLTTIAQPGIEARRVDLSIVALTATETEHGVELETELKIVISDASGRILSILTGGAHCEVARHTSAARLRTFEKQLLDDAMRGMFGPLRAHLLHSVASC